MNDPFVSVKQLIQQQKYEEARLILSTMDDPEAREWERKINALAVPKTTPALPNRTRSLRLWRNVWGVLALLSLAWICYGFTISGNAFTETAAQTTSDAGKAGAAIGASLGITLFICTGLPLALIFLYAYARAGAAIRSERQHREVLEAMKR